MQVHNVDMTVVWVRLRIIAAMIAMTLLLAVCGDNTAKDDVGDVAHQTHASHTTQVAAAEPTDYSIYDLPTTWHDQTGALRTLEDFAGKPRVIAMLYTHCGYSCPLLIADMKRIEGMLQQQSGDVGFVIVSLDSSRDTPGRLAEFARATRLDPERWTLLTAADDGGVLELATLLGVRYRRISDTEFEHSNVITVVDASGRIVYRQEGLSGDQSQSVATLRSLLAVAAHDTH
jgi:protein SCO1/2